MAGEQRKLAAILVADVVGYSKLVGSDEAGTLANLQALRSGVIEPTISKHAGRLFKAVGDGFLVEFASVVQAVACAVEIQKAGPALPLRIGVHLGDVVVQGDDLMGDGVNIAARIEGVADAGGIAISRAVYEQVRGKVEVTFADKGEIYLKNIEHPVNVYVVAGNKPAAAPTPALALPDRPSIAVLPFQNMSGDPEQEYFADGMVEDIITALSRFKSLFVIARNSSFTYRGRAVDIKQVGRDLGVRYVLEGSVRKSTGQVRITGQLIEATTGAHLWADRFDGSLEDVFALQDRVTTSVVSAIVPHLDKAEMARVVRKPVENLDAYDCFLRGLAHSHVRTRESQDEALRLFYRAIELDPDFSTPYGVATRCYVIRVDQGRVIDRNWEAAEVRRLAERVRAIGRDDAHALCMAGFALIRVCHEHDAGEDLIDQAIALNPNMATCWRQRAFASLFAGQHERAIEHAARAIRLDPLDPQIAGVELAMASALLLFGRHEDALDWAKRSHRHDPLAVMNLRVLASAQAFAGNFEEARRTGERILHLDPTFTIARAKSFMPYRRAEDLAKWTEGLRLAGLPE